MRFSRAFLIFVTVFGISSLAYAKARERIEFNMFLVEEKKEYGKNDPILFKLKLKNNGKKPVLVNRRFYINSDRSSKYERDVYLSVKAPDGKEMDYRQEPYDTGLPRTDDFTYLKPAGEVEARHQRNLRAYFDFKEPGTYEVKAVYHNMYGKEIGLDAFRKRLTSNEITIKIAD